jgi:hypothetical protein
MEPTSFAPSIISEALPSQLRYDMSKKISSLVVNREQVVVYPKSGTSSFVVASTGGQQEIIFNISSTPYLVDPQSAFLLMDVSLSFAGTVGANANDAVVVADSICPWFSQVSTLLGGMMHSNILDADILAHFLSWQTSREYYRTKSTFANPAIARWRDRAQDSNPEVTAGAVAMYPVVQDYDLPELSSTYGWKATDAGGNANSGTTSLVRTVAIPLQWLPIFSGSSFLPAQVMGNCELRFRTNQIARMFTQIATDGNPNGNAITQVNLQNCRLVYSSVQVSDVVLEMVRSMSAVSPIHLPCIHYYVSNDATNQTGAQSAPAQYNLNLSTSNLVNLFHFYLEQSQLSGNLSLTYNKNPGFGAGVNSQYYAQIGNLTLPSVSRVLGVGHLYKCYEEASGGSTCLSQEYYAPVQSTVGTDSGAFRLGLSFERLTGSVYNGAVSSGISTKSAAGLIRAYLQPADLPKLPNGTNGVSTLTATDRIYHVYQFLEYILISAAGISTTSIV